MTNSFTLFAILLLLVRNIWVLGANVTTIEGWEIERHATLVRRSKVFGGFLDGPDGIKVRIVRQEFPYDIGIFQNIRQALGANPLAWLWPFAATPTNKSGLNFETNGFEDPGALWPPPDPDRMPRGIRNIDSAHAFTYSDSVISDQDHVQAFKQRQQLDYRRFTEGQRVFVRRTPFRERYKGQTLDPSEVDQATSTESSRTAGEEAWMNSEGERLQDFGVDEDAEFYDGEDEIPLSQLLLLRKQAAATQDG
ncbi:MAG: hypothetical protein Q9195_009150 [Heterodermia aff. obscurata]